MSENSIPVATSVINIKSRAWRSGAIAEAYVALNLSLLGLRVAQTPRGAESVDLVAINPDNGMPATIQVKSSAHNVNINIGEVNEGKPDEEVRADFIVVVPVQDHKIQPVAVVPKCGEDGIVGHIRRIRERRGERDDKKGDGGKGQFCVGIDENKDILFWGLRAYVYWDTPARIQKNKLHPQRAPYHSAWRRILEAVGKKAHR